MLIFISILMYGVTMSDSFVQENVTCAVKGDTGVLDCPGWGHTTVWLKGNATLSTGSDINPTLDLVKYRVVGNNVTGGQNLQIHNISDSDEGIYNCISSGFNEIFIFLDVETTCQPSTDDSSTLLEHELTITSAYNKNVTTRSNNTGANTVGSTETNPTSKSYLTVYIGCCAVCSILLLSAAGIASYIKDRKVQEQGANDLHSSASYDEIGPLNEEPIQTTVSIV